MSCSAVWGVAFEIVRERQGLETSFGRCYVEASSHVPLPWWEHERTENIVSFTEEARHVFGDQMLTADVAWLPFTSGNRRENAERAYDTQHNSETGLDKVHAYHTA